MRVSHVSAFSPLFIPLSLFFLSLAQGGEWWANDLGCNGSGGVTGDVSGGKGGMVNFPAAKVKG